MMGGGGSMQNMQNTLKNNRSLLKGRNKEYFKRERIVAKTKRKLKQLTQGKRADIKLLESIRTRMQRERRVRVFFQVLFAAIVSLMVIFYGFSLLNKKSTVYKAATVVSSDFYVVKKSDHIYVNNMLRGEQNLNAREYFMAIGNYKKALKVCPNDLLAEYGLAKAYSKACQFNHQLCNEGMSFIQLMQVKYPNKKAFDVLYERANKKTNLMADQGAKL